MVSTRINCYVHSIVYMVSLAYTCVRIFCHWFTLFLYLIQCLFLPFLHLPNPCPILLSPSFTFWKVLRGSGKSVKQRRINVVAGETKRGGNCVGNEMKFSLFASTQAIYLWEGMLPHCEEEDTELYVDYLNLRQTTRQRGGKSFTVFFPSSYHDTE